MEKGWISLSRKIQDCFIWEDKPFAKGQAWVDMLLLANHSEKKFLSKNEVVNLSRGSFITSDIRLGERWGWGRKKVRLFLELLENEQMIVTKRNSKGTAITVVNYDAYQKTEFEKEHQKNIKGTSKEHQRNNGGTSKEHQRNTNNNDNNDNNENNVNNENNDNKKHKVAKAPVVYYPNDELLNQSFTDYVEMRKQIKKPMTDKAIQLAMKKLEKLSGGDNDKSIQILEQSVLGSWQGLFELKGDKQKPQRTGGIDWDNV